MQCEERTMNNFTYSQPQHQFQEYSLVTPQQQQQPLSRRSHRRCSVKNVLLKILQISQEKICVGVSFSGDICDIFKNI